MTDIEPRLAEYQLTREEAVQFAEEKRWEPMTPAERGMFQLRQGLLCMPFEKVHEGVTALLGRPVFTHEFADPDSLWAELHGAIPKADFAAILAKIPDGKAVIVAQL